MYVAGVTSYNLAIYMCSSEPTPVLTLLSENGYHWQYKLQRRKWLEKESTGEGKLRKILKEAYSDLKVFKALENPY